MEDHSNSFESDDEDIPFYYNDPEWKDIEPLSQNDGPNAVVQISYPPEFSNTYDFFRAIVKKQEYSQRAFELTKHAIMLNPANYTVWQYRRKILENKHYDLREELEFCRNMIESNPKNYQVWHHRRIIVEWLGDGSKELALTKIIFAADRKNYHAWEHRQWTLKTFRLFEGEISFVEELLDEDIQNNSAWNQRYYVINNTSTFTQQVVENEVVYTQKAIEQLINNESSWNYLRGILEHDERNICHNKQLKDWAYGLLADEDSHCAFLFSFILDIIEDTIKHDGPTDYLIIEAKQICNKLAEDIDRIRCYYWKHRESQILGNCQKTDKLSGN